MNAPLERDQMDADHDELMKIVRRADVQIDQALRSGPEPTGDRVREESLATVGVEARLDRLEAKMDAILQKLG